MEDCISQEVRAPVESKFDQSRVIPIVQMFKLQKGNSYGAQIASENTGNFKRFYPSRELIRPREEAVVKSISSGKEGERHMASECPQRYV